MIRAAPKAAIGGDSWRRGGYTLTEIILLLLLVSVVSASVFAVLRTQFRFYLAQALIADTHDAARVGVEALSSSVRALSPSVGDLYAAAPDSLALRSTTGFGVICEITSERIRLWLTSGVFGYSGDDSLFVFRENDPARRADDEWAAVQIKAVRAASAGLCPNGRGPDLELTVSKEVSGVLPGAPARAFRPHVYRLYRGADGRWWLGQRPRYGTVQPITGPFAPVDEGGLRLDYLEQGGDPAGDYAAIVQVRLALKARSGRSISRKSSAEPFEFRLASSVFLRNSGD